ncbi:hypothetical protein [Dyadobacter sp. OTU695]|uniref:hypothetical protein n=1 Tax=Dyadobacter sp. OTU695 TaxID=3043860 RepID=UPI00313DF4F9
MKNQEPAWLTVVSGFCRIMAACVFKANTGDPWAQLHPAPPQVWPHIFFLVPGLDCLHELQQAFFGVVYADWIFDGLCLLPQP